MGDLLCKLLYGYTRLKLVLVVARPAGSTMSAEFLILSLRNKKANSHESCAGRCCCCVVFVLLVIVVVSVLVVVIIVVLLFVAAGPVVVVGVVVGHFTKLFVLFSSVSAASPARPPPHSSLTLHNIQTNPRTNSPTHSVTLTHTKTLTHAITHPLTDTHSLTHTNSRTQWFTHSPKFTHSPTHPCTHSVTHRHTHTHTHTHALSQTQSLTLTSPTHNHTQKHTQYLTSFTNSLTKAPTHKLTSLTQIMAGVGNCAPSRMGQYVRQWVGCTPLFYKRPLLFASFARQAWTMCTAKGSDVRPRVPRASLDLRLFCVEGVHGQGVGCTSGFTGVRGSPPLLRTRCGKICIACRCGKLAQGVGYTPPWGSSGVRGSPSLLRGKRAALAGKHINRLHCSEWNWRCPGPLPACSPMAPACSKGCQHDTFWRWNFPTTAPLFG